MQNSPAASRGGSGSHGVRLPINIHSSSNSSGGRWGRVWLSEGWGREWVPCKAARPSWPTVAPRVPDTDAGSPTHTRTKPRDRRKQQHMINKDQTKTNTCKYKANKTDTKKVPQNCIFPKYRQSKFLCLV